MNFIRKNAGLPRIPLRYHKNQYIRGVIDVTRAIIVRDGAVLAAQRPNTMSLPLLWELPGGKIEPDEDPHHCLQRETYEELRLSIGILERLPHVDRFFRNKHYRMHPYLCEVTGGTLEVIEHAQATWQPIVHLFDLEWAPAEGMVLRAWMAERLATARSEKSIVTR